MEQNDSSRDILKNEVSQMYKKYAFDTALSLFLVLFGISLLALLSQGKTYFITGVSLFLLLLGGGIVYYIFAYRKFHAKLKEEKYENYRDLFSLEEKEKYQKKYNLLLGLVVLLLLCDVLLLIILSLIKALENTTVPVFVFLFILSLLLFITLYKGVLLDKFPKQKIDNSDNKVDAANTILWIIVVLLYMFMGFVFKLWNPGWVLLVLGGFGSIAIFVIYKHNMEDK